MPGLAAGSKRQSKAREGMQQGLRQGATAESTRKVHSSSQEGCQYWWGTASVRKTEQTAKWTLRLQITVASSSSFSLQAWTLLPCWTCWRRLPARQRSTPQLLLQASHQSRLRCHLH